MKFAKIILLYFCIIIITRIIITEILQETWFYAVQGYIVYLIVFVMLLHIGNSMQDEGIKRKYFIYLSIVFGEIVFFQLLLAALNMHTENTWLGLIATNIVFLTISRMLVDIAKTIKNTNHKISRSLYYIVFVGIMAIVCANIMIVIFGF